MVHMLDDKDKLNPAYKALEQEIYYFENKFKLLGKDNPYRLNIVKHIDEREDRELDIVYPRPLMTDTNGQKFVYLVQLQGYIIQNEIHNIKDGILRIRIPELVDSIDFFGWLIYQAAQNGSMMQYAQADMAQRDISNNLKEVDIIGNSKTILCRFGDIYHIKLEEVNYNQDENTLDIVQTQRNLTFGGVVKFENFDGQNVRQLKAQNWGNRVSLSDTDDLKGLKLKRLDKFQMLYRVLRARPYIDIKSIDFSHVRSLYYGFYYSGAKVIDLADFKFNQIQDLQNAFQDCENLERILNFDSSQLQEQFNRAKYAFRQKDYTDNVPYIQFKDAFAGCKNLCEEDVLRITDGITVDNMSAQFRFCKKLQRFPNIDITKCRDFQYQFYSSGLSGDIVLDGLKYSSQKNPIYITHDIDIPNTCATPWKYLDVSLDDKSSLQGQNILRYYNVYLRNKKYNYTAFPLNSDNLDIFEKPVLYTDGKNELEQLKMADKLQENFKNTPNRLRIVGESFTRTFLNCDKLTQIEIKNIQLCLTLENFQFSLADFDCVEMFQGCKHLKRVVIQNVKVQCSQAEDNDIQCRIKLSNMFQDCENLEEVLIENVDLSDATDGINFEGMFMNCKKLRKLTIRNVIFGTNAFGVGEGDCIRDMFFGCDSLIDGDIQLENINIVSYGFVNMQSLNELIEQKHKLLKAKQNTNDYEKYLSEQKRKALTDMQNLAFRDTVQIQYGEYTNKEINNLRKLFKLCRYLNSSDLQKL